MASKASVIPRKRTAHKQAEVDDANDEIEHQVEEHRKKLPLALAPCAFAQPAYGSGPEAGHFAVVQTVKAIPEPSRSRAQRRSLNLASEGIGEQAAIDMLFHHLRAKGIDYDPKGLFTFSASGVFNLVYLDPPPASLPPPASYVPTWVYVVEAKGGESVCKSCQDPATGATVMQGTLPYLDVVAAKMAKSTYKKDANERARRQFIGKVVQNARVAHNGTYLGVRGSYTDTDLYHPEAIFAEHL